MLKQRRSNTWVAPGFYPFGIWVLEDLKEISKTINISFSKEVKVLESNLDSISCKVEDQDMDGYTPLVKPYDHQVECLSMAIHIPRLGLFLDPGLGKTKVACDLILYHDKQKPNSFWLIVALKVNMFTWHKEMIFHSGGKMNLVPMVKTGKVARVKELEKALSDPKTKGIVVTYDACRVALDILARVPFTDIVLDESHSLRTPNSGKTKAVLALLESKPVGRRLLLSGTPSLGNPMHLWGQLKVFGDFTVPNQWAYSNKFLVRSSYDKHIVTGYKNLEELNDLVTSVSIKKTAEECLDLPERVIQIIEIEPSSKTRKLYNKASGSHPLEVGEVSLDESPNPLATMTRLAQLALGFSYKSLKDPDICNGCSWVSQCVENGTQPYTGRCHIVPKDPGRLIGEVGTTEVLDSVIQLVQGHVFAGKKVIIWAKHRWVLDTLNVKLASIDTTLFRYDSTVKSLPQVESDFNSATKGILIAQISMGIGVTFKAPVMVYTELSWSLDHWLQSLDRNYGIRAKGFKSLLVQVVVIRNSLSHSISKLLQSKIDVSNLMYSTIECISCVHVLDCMQAGIKPFDSGCVLTSHKSGTIPIRSI